ncbi:MAG: glycosyltransferase, partial [Anaerolineaceae bacterium]|nr:glycosyltransferase [Anaerolineaceae bacterium]
MHLSIIVPVYNEEENVPLLYQAVIDAMQPFQQPWELVLVDDGSKDQSYTRL